MKKQKYLSMLLVALFVLSAFLALPVGAASEGVEELAVAASGRNPLMNPEPITGGDGFNDAEGWYGLLVYDEALEEEDKEFPKYCSDQFPYFAEWKYDKAYTVNRIILRTANDSGQYGRLPSDGWTLSGSADGASWEVIYTGLMTDVEEEDYMYFWVDIPDNTKEFEYYRFNVDKEEPDSEDQQIVQLAAIVLCEGEGPVVLPSWKPKSFRLGDEMATITAVDFDSGADNYGKGGNPADGSKTIRPDEDINTEANEAENGYGGNIGWIGEGDWVQYTVRVNLDGKYSFSAWIASDSDTPGNIEVYVGDELVGASDNALKEGWQAYSLFPVGEIEIMAGSQVIKVVFPSGNLNFSALEVTRVGDLEKEEEAPPPAAEVVDEGEAPADGEEAPAGEGADTTQPKATDEEGGSNLILIIVIAGAIVVVIIVALILVVNSKKKKTDKADK